MKYFLVICLALLSALSMGGCGDSGNRKYVAISFANTTPSWKINGTAIKESLEKDGFTVDVEYADTAEQQNEQLEALIAKEPSCIVVGAIDGNAMTKVLAEAKEKNIPIIAYDRLIMNTDAISYYAAFDGVAIGEAMGEYIEDKLQLKSGAGPFYIECFAGAPTDNNAHIFLSASLKVLQPYIDKGQLIVPSKETSFEQVATKDWNPKFAQERLQRLINAHPEDKQLTAILCPNDGISAGLRETLKANGYTQMPLMTGLDAEEAALKAIAAGEQTFTIHKSASVLGDKTVRMIKAVVEGSHPDINDTTSFNNGVITVPAFLCTPLIIDKDNLNEAK